MIKERKRRRNIAPRERERKKDQYSSYKIVNIGASRTYMKLLAFYHHIYIWHKEKRNEKKRGTKA